MSGEQTSLCPRLLTGRRKSQNKIVNEKIWEENR